MGKKELDKKTAIRRFKKRKKEFEKFIASDILKSLMDLEKFFR